MKYINLYEYSAEGFKNAILNRISGDDKVIYYNEIFEFEDRCILTTILIDYNLEIVWIEDTRIEFDSGRSEDMTIKERQKINSLLEKSDFFNN